MNVLFTGDWRFFYPENISDFVHLPSAWDSSLNTGLGIPALNSLWITSYLNFTALFTKLGLSWDLISLIFWILPSIILSFFSAYYLFKTLFPESKRFGFLAGSVYLTNTYFLMIFTGGQMGVALAYSVAPLVLARFIKLINFSFSQRLNFKFLISNYQLLVLAGLALALEVMFDPRIAYVTMAAVLLYQMLNIKYQKSMINIISTIAIPIGIAVLLHSYWILPLILTRNSPLPVGFDSVSSFEFFSFADFSHSLSLLHPNWPENIFGKTYFLQPEFLILPILAYTSLLFLDLRRKTEDLRNRTIISFALLGLIGVFLSKGANPPFGEANIWLFQNFPGMSMFRDPTKWYTLIALSYSILIPFSILKFLQRFNDLNHFKRVKISNVLLSLFLVYSIILIKPIAEKNYIRNVPKEYRELKDFLVSQPEFFRTLWIPQWQRYGFFSNNHPAIGRFEVLKQASASGQIEELRKVSTKNSLQDLAVKYIIVPYDSEGEIFLEDRKYSEERRQEVKRELDKIPWLKKIERFNDLNHLSRIAVYEIPNPKDHFWIEGKGTVTSWEIINSTLFEASVKLEDDKSMLVFAESFDPYWELNIDGEKIKAQKTKDNLNEFTLTKTGTYKVNIEYLPQRYVYFGLLTSAVMLLTILGILGFERVRKR